MEYCSEPFPIVDLNLVLTNGACEMRWSWTSQLLSSLKCKAKWQKQLRVHLEQVNYAGAAFSEEPVNTNSQCRLFILMTSPRVRFVLEPF